jgi:hypothetical protein
MMLKNNKKKKEKIHLALVFAILSLSVVSSLITISAPDYASAQISGSGNATTTDSIPSTSMGMNANSSTITTGRGNQSISEIRSLIEQTRMALQNNDIQGALMNLNSAFDALEGMGDDEQSNMTATPDEIEDGTPTMGAGTIASGGAGGAGTAGGILTGNETTTETGTIASGGAGGAGTAGGILTGNRT